MTNKKNNIKEAQLDSTPPVGELDQLRQIVFGDAQQRLITQISTLQIDMEKALHTQEQSFSKHLENMQKDIEQQFSNVDERIQFLDKSHDTNEANLQKELANLASEHEMFATSTQHEFKNMEQSLENESSALMNNFSEQIEQLKAHLEDVSRELSSSKTDRKTLAKLLATMATNLEDDAL